jgi:ligand-binding sensor domain-containing protein
MKKLCILFCWMAGILPYSSWSQEYSYTHYDITDGLAGSTVYCITQDKEGYIWTGTETGLSRFDGTHFRNYTTIDGLPDIEILQLFADSKGRVWMAPFRKSVCYYYQGRIHNQENDSLLSQIRLQNNIESFAEDAEGNVLIQERNALHLVTAAGTTRQLDSIGNEPVRACMAVGRNADGAFLAQIGSKVVSFSTKGILWRKDILFPYQNPNLIVIGSKWGAWMVGKYQIIIQSFTTNKHIGGSIDNNHFTHVSFSLVNDSVLYSNDMNGSHEYNIGTGLTKHFLPGKEVSRSFRDAAGNLWFTTLGEGIFRLNSDEFRTISLRTGASEKTAIHAVKRVGNDIWACNNYNYFFKLSLPNLSVKMARPYTVYAKDRTLFLDTMGSSEVLAAGDLGVELISRDLRHLRQIDLGIKSAYRINKDQLLLAASSGAGILDLTSFRITDTLWRERATAVYYHADTIYIGTLGGLYRSVHRRPLVFLGAQVPFLRKRISSITGSADGTLWIASYDDAGVIGYKGDKVVAIITKKEGLTSGICRTLLIQGAVLWIGTDKGLNKVQLDKADYPVTRYTTNDGLGSDMVNTIFADGSMIYVGTSAGLSFFDESKVNVNEECRLYLQSLINSGRERIEDTARVTVPYTDRNIRFEFAAISYRSVGAITYRYRMKGLDNNWRVTKETFLEYPSLPSGDYEWQLMAVNKFGESSRVLSIPVIVATPFWKTLWFNIITGGLFLLLVWLAVLWRIRMIRSEQKKKDSLTKKVGELENMALQAQMNPHFIFNCLNSIQQFIFEQDVLAANKYISSFARLIRVTLHNSSRPFISLADEVDYLSTYLSLEKMRFKEKMDYVIELDPAIDRDVWMLPPMLIQPYVENSIRHGIRHKTEGKGLVRIAMQQQEERLVVIIEDNGIGRRKARMFKTNEHIEYQSKGMSLTADRIRMMDALYKDTISVEVEDIEDRDGLSSGTRVVIKLPAF